HPETREAGTAAYERSRDRLYTEGFANRKGVARFVGGVVYVDRDGDGFYSVGEGVGGVKVTASDGASATTWKSGGYALELPDTEALTVTFTDAAGKTWQAKVPAGADNAKVDWKRKP
ncbi:MAG: hypothetical protein KC635_30310, partial [Myxococcales bacterium]|nr:hypothetical protein [Myxococcales bacterium]